MVSITKDPNKVRAGHAGALKRWADPGSRTTVRIADLTPAQRRLVLALIDAAREDREGVSDAA